MAVRRQQKNQKYEKQNSIKIFILDFIVACRSGHSHDYDIVEGPMADDTIYNYVQGYIDGKYSRTVFWELAKFKHPTHQISFHTEEALKTLHYVEGVMVYGEK